MTGSDLRSSPSAPPVTCESCRKEIPVLVQAQTRFVSCVHCGSYYEVSRTGAQYRKKFSAHYAGKTDPVWKLSTKLTLNETKYTVVGYMVKKEETENVYWREYILFTPYQGYAYLAEYNGHWVFLKATNVHPSFGKKLNYEFDLEGESYRLYHRYKAQLMHAQGEFAYDVTSEVQYTEYIYPPYMMTREVRQKEVRWYKGEYLSPEEVAQASQEAKVLPPRIGVGACQPNHLRQHYYDSLLISIAAFVILLLLQCFLALSARNTQVLAKSYDVRDSITYSSYAPVKGQPIVTPSFELKDGTKNLVIRLDANVNNSWFEAEMTLVNEQTGAERDLNMGVEFYHGYEGGESWAEGSPAAEEVLSAVPEGMYHLVIVPVKPTEAAHFEIWLKRDVPSWSNFWITLLLLCVGPGIQYVRTYYFEKQRWMNSDYSPYEE